MQPFNRSWKESSIPKTGKNIPHYITRPSCGPKKRYGPRKSLGRGWGHQRMIWSNDIFFSLPGSHASKTRVEYRNQEPMGRGSDFENPAWNNGDLSGRFLSTVSIQRMQCWCCDPFLYRANLQVQRIGDSGRFRVDLQLLVSCSPCGQQRLWRERRRGSETDWQGGLARNRITVVHEHVEAAQAPPETSGGTNGCLNLNGCILFGLFCRSSPHSCIWNGVKLPAISTEIWDFMSSLLSARRGK